MAKNNMRLTIERTKQLVDPDMSDEEAEKVRDACRALAELMFSQWLEEKNKNKLKYEPHK